MADAEDPISLRQIFIPLRLAKEDLADEKMPTADDVEDEKEPGEAAWDILARHALVMISGRPGSGKTTLVKALLTELCTQEPSRLRKQLTTERGIAPIPLILRDIPDLHTIQTLDQLLAIWWEKEQEEASDKNYSLDLERLHYSFAFNKENFPLLLLFDGIDEVGGLETRKTIMQMVTEALNLGHRVLVTGRPAGFNNLLSEKKGIFNSESNDISFDPSETLYHLQPFSWNKITLFIQRWYQLSKEWKLKRELGLKQFLQALKDPKRAYLLSLARRPIFLTLMALVHVSRNEMPHGRAELYKAIIELYLIRQDKKRQLGFTTQGNVMPHWADNEKRLALGYIAWLSQQRSSEIDINDNNSSEQRRVIWPREELEQKLCHLLSGKDKKAGRFVDLTEQDSHELVDYFLNPAGLLVEPAENQIQFAHLSFQEYLCADYLYGRAQVRGMSGFLTYTQEQLFAQLKQPGWDEVGLLFFTIHADHTQKEGHFELLQQLNPAQYEQARLLLQAVCGQELPFTLAERKQWLPLAVTAALLHPDAELAKLFRQQDELKKPGLKLIQSLFIVDTKKGEKNGSALWQALSDQWLDNPEQHSFFLSMQKAWLSPESLNSSTWKVNSCSEEARYYSLLVLLNTSGWADFSEHHIDNKLSQILANWVETKEQYIFYPRNSNNIPEISNTSFELDALLSDNSLLPQVLKQTPIDLWLLMGEIYDIYLLFSQPAILLSLYSKQVLPARTYLAITLYQCLLLTESTGIQKKFNQFTESRALAQSRARYRAQSPSRTPSRAPG